MILLGFFFFKQKSAYEMRISDWSSDVGSSDLVVVVFGHRLALRNQSTSWPGLVKGLPRELASFETRRSRGAPQDEVRFYWRIEFQWQRSEERRVGTDVSVRVDLGGSRSIKNNTNTKKQQRARNGR